MSELTGSRTFGEMWNAPESRQAMLSYYRLAVNVMATAADYLPVVGSELAFSDSLLKVFARLKIAGKVASKATKLFSDFEPLPKTSFAWKAFSYGISKIPFAPGRLVAYAPTFKDDLDNNRFRDGAACFKEGLAAIGTSVADKAMAIFTRKVGAEAPSQTTPAMALAFE